MKKSFDIPVVLIIFKREDTVLQILDRIREVKPSKMYIISDAGRDMEEDKIVKKCRNAIDKAIDWECNIIKNYATENRGVHAQIGLGARWVFSREKFAIFLEDDNLPEVTFFDYCKQCLQKYYDDENIFWICGTNYLEKCNPTNNSSVFASRHLMPCGWASWAHKFNKYYDYDFKLADDSRWESVLRTKYKDVRLYKQQLRNIKEELQKKSKGERYRSWDYHTAFSIRMNNLYGIVPKFNQIENIGVDEFSTHGGTSMDSEMTRRFCSIKSFPLYGELVLPDSDNLDFSFENEIGKIILFPVKVRIINQLREWLNVPEGVRLREAIFYKIRNYESKD